ncbi:hypothetical protein CR513_59109, partial [Mucuna pruriens]
MGGNKGSTQMWVNQTIYNKENGVEHPSTLQLDQDIQAFSKEKIDRLRALLNSTSKSFVSCGLTMNSKSSFNISSSILDSGAADHMTSFPSHFTSYLKVSKRQPITVANGDHVPISRSSNVQLHSSLSLHDVLHVPKLPNNLIFIHRLIQDWNCAVTFFHSHCVTTPIWKNFLLVNGQPQKLGKLLKFGIIINILDIHRLGYLRQLFIKESVESFKCDICQFSKYHRATFSPSNNKSLEPFDLIHSDVWGPASNSISGVKWFVSFIDDCTHVT